MLTSNHWNHSINRSLGIRMDDPLRFPPRSDSIIRTAQADTRNYFQPSPEVSPGAVATPTGVSSQVRKRSDRARDAIFGEWTAPVYRPSMPRSKSNGKPLRKPSRPINGHVRAQTEDLGYTPIVSSSRSGPRRGHARAHTEDLTNISAVPRRDLTSESKNLHPIPVVLPATPLAVDLNLIPKPLKLTRRHSPSPSVDGCTFLPELDTSDSFRKSTIMAILEKQRLGIEPSFADLMGKSRDASTGGAHHTATKPIFLRPEFQPSGPTEDDEAIMYFLPSPSMTSSAPDVPDKARRILGEAGAGDRLVKPSLETQPVFGVYAGPTGSVDCETSRQRLETAQELRVAKGNGIEIIDPPNRKNKKAGKFARLIWGGAVNDTVT